MSASWSSGGKLHWCNFQSRLSAKSTLYVWVLLSSGSSGSRRPDGTHRPDLPHCLRATAANPHAYKGVAPVPLQALMGWSDLATAQKYIRISGTATADALRTSTTDNQRLFPLANHRELNRGRISVTGL